MCSKGVVTVHPVFFLITFLLSGSEDVTLCLKTGTLDVHVKYTRYFRHDAGYRYFPTLFPNGTNQIIFTQAFLVKLALARQGIAAKQA